MAALGVAALGVLSAGCTAPKHQAVALHEEPTPPPPPGAVSLPGPAGEGSSDPSENEDVDLIISRAQGEFDLGVELLNAGDAEQAREHWDHAVEAFLNGGVSMQQEPRLQQAFDRILEDIAALEKGVVDAPEGDSEAEPAPVDDLLDINPTITPKKAEDKREKITRRSGESTYDIPMVVNDKVLAWVDLFQNNSVYRKSFMGGFERYGLYESMIHGVMSEEGLPFDLIYLAFLESTYKTNAYSRARAKGIWQFMTTTGRQYGLRIDRYVDERSHPEKSTRAAARYLKDLYATFNDWHLAMAAYNTGAGNILRGQRRSGKKDYWSIAATRYMHRDTKNFVPAILALALMGKNPDKYGFSDLEHFAPLEYDTVTVEGPARLSLIARLADVSVEELRSLNPHLRRDVTPPGPAGAPGSGSYEVMVPRGTGTQVAEAYALLPRSEKIAKLDTEHTVRQGETLASIAARYGVSVNELARANGIRNPRNLRAGARLVVPHGGSDSYVRERRAARQDYDTSAPYHTVRRGETLSAISRAYGVSLGRLYSWNSMGAGTILKPGMRIRVQPGSEQPAQPVQTAQAAQPEQTAQGKLFYRVKPGDNLFQIARRYGTTVSNIKAWNKIDGDTIRTGETLTIYSD